MSRRCPFCHIVHGRIRVSLQHPPTYRRDSLAPARRSVRRAVIHGRLWPGSWPGPAHGPRETMIAVNKRRLGPGPRGVPPCVRPGAGPSKGGSMRAPRPPPYFRHRSGRTFSVMGFIDGCVILIDVRPPCKANKPNLMTREQKRASAAFSGLAFAHASHAAGRC
jgi:hypothetical protein